MAKDILRQDVKDVIAAYKGGELGARSVATQRVPPVGIGVKNTMFSNVATGTPLKIDGFSQELEYEAALAKLLNNALYLAATAPDETTPVEQIATTLEPIPAGKLGRAEASIFPAKVTFPEGGDDCEFASATFVAAEGGPFRIVAKSKLSAERVAVCALAKIAGSENASGVLWDNLDGTSIVSEFAGALPNSIHVRGGSGIRVVDGGACSHGALDGFIAQIDWTGYEVDGESTRALRLGV
ncbi:MAG: hypothetical protein IKU86_08785, partial [Thermoguttaceae bacterium]|nr:hypothetical protein [Thermoguttaceae bacterium]